MYNWESREFYPHKHHGACNCRYFTKVVPDAHLNRFCSLVRAIVRKQAKEEDLQQRWPEISMHLNNGEFWRG